MGRAGVVAVLSILCLVPVAPAPAAQSNPHSQWRPACGIDGRTMDLSYFFCNMGYFDGEFDGAPNDPFFGGAGAYLNLAVYDSSQQGFRLWGPRGDHFSQYEELGPSATRGTGAPEDPFEIRSRFAAGSPRQLVVRPHTRYVDGRGTFEMWWEIENVSDAPVSFRATVFADIRIHEECAYGDLKNGPRLVGSYSPEEGVPYDPNDCTFPERARGFSGYAVERPGSEWSAYQQGDEYDILGRISAAGGPGLANTYRSNPGPEALAIQWDRHGRGGSPLAPGATARFELGWRFTSDLLVTPFLAESRDNVHRVKLSTRHAAGGPMGGRRIAWEIDRRHVSGGGVKRGTVRTNRRGVAWLRWKEGAANYDSLTVGFDSNRDGRVNEKSELYRFGMMVDWIATTDHYRARLSFERTSGGFGGEIRAIHEKDPDFGADCREYRTIAIRRREGGRDPVLASAVSNRRGRWELTVDAPRGSYYGVVIGEWRSQGNGLGYRCRAARAR